MTCSSYVSGGHRPVACCNNVTNMTIAGQQFGKHVSMVTGSLYKGPCREERRFSSDSRRSRQSEQKGEPRTSSGLILHSVTVEEKTPVVQ
jgi:hypothetical protein